MELAPEIAPVSQNYFEPFEASSLLDLRYVQNGWHNRGESSHDNKKTGLTTGP